MGSKFVTLDADEFNRVCKRVHGLLTMRADKAWDKHQNSPNEKTSDKHIEASKDAFAFIHLLELVEHMTEEIHNLRMYAAAEEGPEILNQLGEAPSKRYMN